MNTQHDTERRLAAWLLDDAPDRAPAHLREAVGQRLDRVSQRRFPRLIPEWRRGPDPRLFLAVPVVLLTALGIGLLAGGAAGPAPSPPAAEAHRAAEFGQARQVTTLPGTTVDTLVSTDGKLAAVGSTGADASQRGAAWVSADGVTWTSVAAQPPDATVPFMTGVSGNASREVAIGLLCPTGAGSERGCTGVGSATLRPDGLTWTAVHWLAGSPAYGTPQFAGPGATGYGYLISALAAGPQADVMVGTAMELQGTSVASPAGPAVATSVDGVTWRWRVLSEATAGAGMVGVAAGPSGVVAVGSDPSQVAKVWVSADGTSWDELTAGGELDAVAAGRSGFVAVGRNGADASVWLSADGHTWRPADRDAALANAWMTDVAWTGDRYVAGGRTEAGDGAAWASADGAAWTRIDTGTVFTGAPVRALAPIGSRLVMVGQTPAGDSVIALAEP